MPAPDKTIFDMGRRLTGGEHLKVLRDHGMRYLHDPKALLDPPDTNAELLKEIRGLRADLARQRWLPDTPLVRKILAELEQRD